MKPIPKDMPETYVPKIGDCVYFKADFERLYKHKIVQIPSPLNPTFMLMSCSEVAYVSARRTQFTVVTEGDSLQEGCNCDIKALWRGEGHSCGLKNYGDAV